MPLTITIKLVTIVSMCAWSMLDEECQVSCTCLHVKHLVGWGGGGGGGGEGGLFASGVPSPTCMDCDSMLVSIMCVYISAG